MQIIYRFFLSILLTLQLSLAGAMPSHAHLSGEISQEGYRATTYNLTVAKAHTFFIGEEQIWVHNVGPCDVINNALKGRSNIKTVTSADASKYGLQKSSGSNTLYDPVTQVNYAVGKDGLIYEVSSLSGFNPIPLSKPLTSATNRGVPTPVVVSKMPKELVRETSSGLKLVVDPNKTTTVLGNHGKDMQHVLSELDYPKTLDFGTKKGGFNVLNTPDGLYKNPTQFWNDYNKPFLDDAIKRGDNFPLATKPTLEFLYKDGSLTGFGREIDYLTLKGYKYDPSTSSMVK